MSYEVNKQIVQMSSVCFGVLKLNKNQEGTGVAVNNNIPTIIFSSKFVHLHSYVPVNNDSLQEMIIPLKIKGEWYFPSTKVLPNNGAIMFKTKHCFYFMKIFSWKNGR